jgi:hypothetical protein
MACPWAFLLGYYLYHHQQNLLRYPRTWLFRMKKEMSVPHPRRRDARGWALAHARVHDYVPETYRRVEGLERVALAPWTLDCLRRLWLLVCAVEPMLLC